MTSILREKNLLDIKTTDFTLEFPRNETVNIQSKAQAFNTLLTSGMHPELAAKKSGVSNDPVADMKMSEKYLILRWGDPDAPDMMMDEGTAPPKNPNAIGGSSSENDEQPGTRSYKRKRNGKWETVNAYTKTSQIKASESTKGEK